MTSEQEDILNETFRSIGEKYGYQNTNAEFAAYRDFKVRWTRSYRWANFQVSDYISDAPREVFEGLADTLLSKISGCDEKPYSKEMRDWVTSVDFVKAKQPIYLKRSRNLTKDHVGKHRDLLDSISRLSDYGFIKDTDNMVLSWTREELVSKVGYCSTLMETIAISSVFDDPIVPEHILDYVVLHEYLTMREGKLNFGNAAFFDLVEQEQDFPYSREAEAWINRMCLHL